MDVDEGWNTKVTTSEMYGIGREYQGHHNHTTITMDGKRGVYAKVTSSTMYDDGSVNTSVTTRKMDGVG